MNEKIKAHIKKHKGFYSCVSSGLIVAGFTVIIMRRNSSEAGFLADDVAKVGVLAEPQGISSSIFGDSSVTINNSTTNHYESKALSYIVNQQR